MVVRRRNCYDSFKEIEHYDAFSDSVIFWCDATNIPQKYVEEAKKIDGENYSSDCFGVCVVLDVDGFGICKELDIEAEACELYYVDNTGEKDWMKVVLSKEEAKTFYVGCMEEITSRLE